ncbi:MAG TPA: matrixin family metalloprotease [Kofleriaceae bacterium]|nr:matrixin family metalloprotease [Kofleriaceae bacterium]
MRSVALVLAVLGALAHAAHAQPSDLDALVAHAPTCDAERARCLPLALHVTVTDTGPIATADWLAAQVAAANRHFERLGVGFQIESIAALPASAARVEDREERDSFAGGATGRVIHVFVTGHLDDIDTAGKMAYGVTWRRGTRKYIILSTQAWERTLAHELGHVFGLPHSTYAISIMNKTDRTDPPVEQRTFHDDEYAIMKQRLAALVRARTIVPVKPR